MADQREHDAMEDGRHTLGGDDFGEEDTALLSREEQLADMDFEEQYNDEQYNEIDQGRWDDDPNPYDGTYSEA